MPSSIQPYVDGYFGPEGIELTVVPRPKFPFQNNPTPDTYSREYERDWEVAPNLYLPKTSRRTGWTNLLQRSEDLTNASWTKTNATPTLAQGTAPDGLVTLNKLLEDVPNGEHAVSQAATVANIPTEASIFVVGGLNRPAVRIAFTDSAAAVFSAFFDLNSGASYSIAANTTARAVNLGNGHLRIVIKFTPAAGAGTFKVNLVSSGVLISYAGDATKGAFLWGGQVSSGVLAPYVSTTTATRTISAPDLDSFDPFAFLVTEADPQPKSSRTEMVRKLFARVPLQQVLPGSIYVTKPTIPGTFPQQIGASVIFQPDPSAGNYDFYTAQAVTGDTGASTGSLTGGSYQLTYGVNTTSSIAFDANAATVQSAINALASISSGDGVTVSGSAAAGFNIVFNNHAFPTVDATSITVTGGSKNSIITDNSGRALLFTTGLGQALFVGIQPQAGQAINGGTFTITFFGQTTAAIAYNATATTVQSAINALSNVTARGGVTILEAVTGGTGSIFNSGQVGFLVFFNAYSLFTATTSLLTPLGSTAASSFDFTPHVRALNTFSQTLRFTVGTTNTRSFTVPAHGITTADNIFVLIGSSYFTIPAGSFTVPDANTIAIQASAGAAYTATGSATKLGKKSNTSYTAGLKLTRCNRVSDFYLPGVTPGIATAADIPLPTYQGDPASLLAAIFAGSTQINYEVGDLVQYKGTSILMRTITQLNASTL